MKSGEVIEFDVIIFGTGFSLDATEITTRGRNGLTVNEWYATQDGPTGYKGTCIPGYPNFFTLLGMSFLPSRKVQLYNEFAQVPMLPLVTLLLSSVMKCRSLLRRSS